MSLHLFILKFFSSVVCSFHHTNPVHVLLDLHLLFLFSDYKWYCILNSRVHMFIAKYIEIQLTFYSLPVFCKLAVYSLISSRSFLWILQIFCIDNHHVQVGIFLFLSSQSESLFILFSYFIKLARTFSIMLSKSGESRHLCLVSYLSGKSSSVSLLSMMLAVGLL